jgi:hypothetical protein
MRTRRAILATLAVMGIVYLGSPYLTLYRLNAAVRQQDAGALQSMVDWYAVREGLKEDLCDMVLDEPSSQRPANELAPFGESFVRGITGNAVDQAFTPETFVSMTHNAADQPRAGAHVEWAFFENPMLFSVNVRPEGVAEPIRMELELRHMHWQVRRVWLPNALLERAGSGT